SAGGGLFYKNPEEENWHWIPQPVDPREDYDSTIISKPTTTNVLNVTYDIAIHNDEVWIASWGGGVRKSADNGQTWIPVTPDGRKYDVAGYESHRGFSLLSENENIWMGTAGGLGKINETDTTLYTFEEGGNSISGNWVIGLSHQKTTGWVWAITLRALEAEEYNSISATPDGGETWYNFLTPELSDGTFARYIDFVGDSIFIATEKGMYFSGDMGENWHLLGYMTDENTGDRILNSLFYSVAIETYQGAYRYWFGSSQGLVSTTDLLNYKIYRRYVSHADREKPFTFAYPSPFSPRREHKIRIQFYLEQNSYVKVGIYNFAMEKVVEISENIAGIASEGNDRFVVWDGKDASRHYVANGVYFYKLKIESKTWWGKIVVLN
ncbi:MAG: hypothetical protein KAR38_01750, partial [Calditrichia bacterium]|nr:hypothetical protein [Calditrichia bacterium]